MHKIKYLAAAFALLFALSVNMTPAMADSYKQDKSSKYENQDKHQDKDKSDSRKHEKRNKDKNKADDKHGKNKADKNNHDD